MKIMQIIPSLGLGGAEIMCENLSYELKALGHNVIVVSLIEKESFVTQRLKAAGIDIVYLKKKSGLDFSVFYKLYRLFKQEYPDVIHTHLGASRYVFPVATFMKIRIVHTVHNVATKDEVALIRKINGFFYKFLKITPVALSEEIKKTIVNAYGLKEVNVPVVFNGVDLSNCKEKKDYSVRGNFKILHVGRFFEQKNHIGLLRAFKLFHSEVNASELWLVGDGEKRIDIENFISENNLDGYVKLFGLQKDSYKFLSEADVFTLPSIYEGMPMALIEAMGTGLPIVVTAVGGVPDMLSENVSQLVPVDEEAISRALKRYYDDLSLREKHGRNVKILAENFSSTTMAKKYLEIYSS